MQNKCSTINVFRKTSSKAVFHNAYFIKRQEWKTAQSIFNAVSDFVCFVEAIMWACLFSYTKARQGRLNSRHNKYHEKVTFPSVICATSKSNYMENDVCKAVCVSSLSKQQFQHSFHIHLWKDKQVKHTRAKNAVYILAYLERFLKTDQLLNYNVYVC